MVCYATADSPSQCHRLAFFCTTSLCSYICRNFSRRPNQVLPKNSGKETNLLIQSFKVWIPTWNHVLKPQSLKSQENVIQWIPYTKSYLWVFCDLTLRLSTCAWCLWVASSLASRWACCQGTPRCTPARLRRPSCGAHWSRAFSSPLRCGWPKTVGWKMCPIRREFLGLEGCKFQKAMMASWYVFLVCWKFWLENIGRSKKGSFLIAMSEEMKAISCNWIRMN